MMAAAQEMNERGVKFTVDAVAARLGCSKKTLYQYYRSKEELIAAMVQAAMDDEEAQEQAILESDLNYAEKLAMYLNVTPQIFGRINDWVIDDIRRFLPDEWAKIEAYHRAKRDNIRGLLDAGVAAGHLRPVETRVAAQMLLDCNLVCDYPFLQENNLTFTDVVRVYADIFLYGVLKQAEGKGDDEG
jgi:AcrR family transcriptional regulator